MNWPVMDADEIHEFGLRAILPHLIKEGVAISEINVSLGKKPQVIGTRWGSAAHIYVRTGLYPNKGELSDIAFANGLEWAVKNDATAFFASVGLACTNYPDKSPVKDETNVRLPIRNAGFAISYEGLLVMTTSDKIRVMGSSDS
jgi:hypothetical protein